MREKTKDMESGVSPVVGVMLMLVVTIIIAALVSGFAGGLSESSEKPQQITLKATYSQSQGMTITHAGGDVIPTTDVKLLVRPARTFGDAAHRINEINPAIITNDGSVADAGDSAAANRWKRETGMTGIHAFRPGDTHYIPVNNSGSAATAYKNSIYNTENSWQLQQNDNSATYTFKAPANLGKTFFLEMVDSFGRTIAKTEVVIRP
ncbi:type IV pilin N-terminal domain-containing protein [Methanocalculus sp. MC3]